MKILTIKELAPYLPYGLKVLSERGSVYELDIYYNMMGNGIEKRDLYSVLENGMKPLLRPLSYITEQIEHNGERFVPIDKFELEGYVIGYNGFSITIGQEEGYSFGYAIDVYNQIIQKLHEWHFDTSNLLGRGLALPIDGKDVKP